MFISPPTLTMIHLCITHCTYWMPLFITTCIGHREELKNIPNPSIYLNLDSALTNTFTQNFPLRNLGLHVSVIFDQNFSFSDYIAHPSRSCFKHRGGTFHEILPPENFIEIY